MGAGETGPRSRKVSLMAKESSDWYQSLQYVASSDIGMRRANNQDSWIVSLAADEGEWFQRGHLFVVADGMGAHAAGELASKIAVDQVAHIYAKHPELSPPERLETALREANQEIHRRGEANLDFHNMGTTCSALLLLPQGVLIGHVGDSRIYRLRDQHLHQLTFDHSLVWEMREAGQLGGGNAAVHVPKNVITRSLGPQPSVKIDLEGPFPVELHDRYLLCSDGLTGKVTDAEIAAALGLLAPTAAADLLVNLANLRGGPDNITLILVQITSPVVTTRAAGATPLVAGRRREPRPSIHPAWWIAAGASGLLAAALFVAHSLAWAWLPLAICLLLLVGLALRALDLGGPDGLRLTGGRRLGKGPHGRSAPCPPAEFTGQVLEGLSAARQTVQEMGWVVDWSEFDRQLAMVDKSRAQADHTAALLHCTAASGWLIEQTRRHGSDFQLGRSGGQGRVS